jgi:hypothetical protein
MATTDRTHQTREQSDLVARVAKRTDWASRAMIAASDDLKAPTWPSSEAWPTSYLPAASRRPG